MQAQFLDSLAPFAWPLESSDLAAACGCVADHRESLLPEERLALANVGTVRADAYSSGRRVAHEALRGINIDGCAIGKRGRVPVWPSGVVGSITHSRALAIAVVARRKRFAALGVDVEPFGRISRRVAERVLSERERSRLVDDSWRTLLFSAKEAVYKALNPLTGEFLAFRDVEIVHGDGRFTARTTRPCASTSAIAVGEGFFLAAYDHWLTLFVCRSGAAELPTSDTSGETAPTCSDRVA